MMIVISLIPLLILGLMLWNLFNRKARVRRVIKNGVEANAVLLNIDYTTTKTEKLVRLQIQVYPKTGRNFVIDIPDFSGDSVPINYRIGDLLKVKYNPLNTKEIVIVSGS